MGTFVNLILRLLHMLNVALWRWAGRQWGKAAAYKKRGPIAEKALSEIAPYGATQKELKQAYMDIVKGAPPAAVIDRYRLIAQSRNRANQ